MKLGLLPALGNNLTTLRDHGQLTRFRRHCAWYTNMQPEYFGYSRADKFGALREAIRMPLRPEFKACDVLRVFSLTGALPAILSRKPYLCSYGADYEAIARIHGRSRRAKRYRWLARLVLRTAEIVLCPNQQLAKLLHWRHPKANVVYHPNWVDTDLFTPGQTRGVGVLYVGRLVKEKNLHRLALAAEQAGSGLTCVGDGPERPAGAACMGVTPWEELPRWFHAHRIFAMVSLSEGHPKALAEAMACGMPCVLSERVTEGIGERCLAEDTESIAEAIRALMTDPNYAADLGTRSRAYALAHWQEGPLMQKEVEGLWSLA